MTILKNATVVIAAAVLVSAFVALMVATTSAQEIMATPVVPGSPGGDIADSVRALIALIVEIITRLLAGV